MTQNPRIAVVGGGMAAARFAERYGALGGRGTVTVYGAEPRAPYNRVLLADVLTGRYDAESIALPLGGAEPRPGCEVVTFDPVARTLGLADGTVEPWDELVLATGSNPVLPPVRGLRRPDGQGLAEGVHTLRTLDDCGRLAEEAVGAKRAVVIGGGVLGVSAARALAALGVRTEIVHQGPHLIERQLDREAAAVLRERLLALGVECYPGNRARAVHGGERVGAVELANGYRLDCDLVVLACGTRPRTALAHVAGLPVGTGVLVDDGLATAAPHVYAIGDCAEHRGTVHGLAGPAWDQADVLARRLSGADPDATYSGTRPRARLSTGDLEYAAFGAVDETLDPGLDVLRITDATRGSYKKLVLRGDRLVGAILLGDLATVDALAGAFAEGGALAGHPLHLLTRGELR
ncbi:NAD(P)/FAD-dependent oxidoreductase [Streptomyces kaniharaensis]|uniref:NAD(P)/FAD-dependent oxidoreductase n=1 Tax=Streptomyces kaniharaensis TaxID=212423 RepID=A0A6N7KLB6_9ACTN|nr:FAD-dependent oxidoreductase [Streptomyces kaniharaensis]MQS11238.1 NAD(P)/FAD-dependent oxidoreductase [Streptomyces kaniharaensis]